MYIESAYKYVNVLDGINFSWLTVKTKDKIQAFNVLNHNLPQYRDNILNGSRYMYVSYQEVFIAFQPYLVVYV